ncbi:guanylate-binding protein 6-like isoform X2 [Nannospalax galili]|nr:guanylate-binding protein 6-like isoform X2 [Nannospalax galili]XP_029411133.1 guanylate-binding protein 6-like isoform X2 [Nannospalax galili]
MASESTGYPVAPTCLVDYRNGQLSINKDSLRTLQKIAEPVVAVAIVGLYNKGKSYLMNLLAEENIGFLLLDPTIESDTKGIWIWNMPHTFKPNHRFVLLSVEGLGDGEKGDPKSDSWLFTLAVLLSSTLIYNSVSSITDEALEQLHYVTELTELIRVKSAPSPDGVKDAVEFMSFFPDFIWTLLDFTLELETAGRPVTEDEYLEKALKLIPGDSLRVQNANKSRECIRRFFPKRKCFVFDPPTYPQELQVYREEDLEIPLDSKFQKQSKNFSSYIFTHAKTKTLRGGMEVSGEWMGTLVEAYVNAINSGMIPCLENAVTTLARSQNSEAVEKAAKHYTECFVQKWIPDINRYQEVLDVHAACEREAIAVFMEHSFKDDKQEFQKRMLDVTMDKKVEFLLMTEGPSYSYCRNQLDRLSKALKKGISKGNFSVPGGHKLYKESKEKIEQEYWQLCSKGTDARELFQRFLKLEIAKEKTILQADTILSDEEKAMAVEQAKTEAAENKQELLRQCEQEHQHWVKVREKSLKENIEQLKRKLERERDRLVREMSVMVAYKLQLQKDFLEEGFEKKFEEMGTEINYLKNMISTTKNIWVEQTLDRFGNELASILSVPSIQFAEVHTGMN